MNFRCFASTPARSCLARSIGSVSVLAAAARSHVVPSVLPASTSDSIWTAIQHVIIGHDHDICRQSRRLELAERASGLQRWAVALSLEAARQQEAAKALRNLEREVEAHATRSPQYCPRP